MLSTALVLAAVTAAVVGATVVRRRAPAAGPVHLSAADPEGPGCLGQWASEPLRPAGTPPRA